MSGNECDTPEWRLAHPDDYPTGDVIVKDATHALMAQRTFDRLGEYSSSIPSGKIPGKHWKCLCSDGVWVVRWYEQDPDSDAHLLIPARLVLIA